MYSQVVSILMAVAMLLSFSACATTKAGVPADPSESKPTIFVMVHDTACDQVAQRIKNNMKNDPELGLALEEPIDNGYAYELPIIHKDDLRYSATVRILCKDSLSSQVSVGMDARRKSPDGNWVKVGDTSELERMILDKVLKP